MYRIQVVYVCSSEGNSFLITTSKIGSTSRYLNFSVSKCVSKHSLTKYQKCILFYLGHAIKIERKRFFVYSPALHHRHQNHSIDLKGMRVKSETSKTCPSDSRTAYCNKLQTFLSIWTWLNSVATFLIVILSKRPGGVAISWILTKCCHCLAFLQWQSTQFEQYTTSNRVITD